MRHVLVPVLTPQDIEALPNLVQFLASQKPLAVVVLHNPSLGVTGEDATKDVDARIVAMENSKKEAAAREDYPAAEQMRQQLEGLKMERIDILREGWRKASTEVREKAYSETILKDFVRNFSNTNTHVRQVILEEDTNYDGLFGTLAGMTKVWPNCLPMGDFSVVYPRTARTPPLPNLDQLKPYLFNKTETTRSTESQFCTTRVGESLGELHPGLRENSNPLLQGNGAMTPIPTPSASTVRPSEPSGGTLSIPANKKAVANPRKTRTVPSDPRAARDVELSRYMKLKQVAKQKGISLEGRDWKEVKNEILSLEFPVAA